MYEYLKDSADVELIKTKLRDFYVRVFKMKTVSADCRATLEHKRTAILRQLLGLKKRIMNEMLKQKDIKPKGGQRLSKAQLAREKERQSEETAKYISVKEDTLRHMATTFLRFKRVRHHILDHYALLQRNMAQMAELHKVIAAHEAKQRKREARNERAGMENAGEAREPSSPDASSDSDDQSMDPSQPEEIERRRKKRMHLLLENVKLYNRQLPLLLDAYEKLELELGLIKLREQPEPPKKEKDAKGKKGGKQKEGTLDASIELTIEQRAERAGIVEIGEMNARDQYPRPKFFSWASTVREARVLIDQAVILEESQKLREEQEAEE